MFRNEIIERFRQQGLTLGEINDELKKLGFQPVKEGVQDND